MNWVGPSRVPGARGSLAQGWGPRHRECAARVSAGACAPCARGVRSRGAAGTRRLGAPLPRCGSRDALPRRLSAPPRCPHRGTAGLGVPLRSSSFSGLLRLWPRGRVRLSGPDSASGRALVTLSRRPFLPALESGGRGRPGACSPHRLRVCRGGGGDEPPGLGRGRACGLAPGAGQKRKRQMSLGIAALAPPVAAGLWGGWEAEERSFHEAVSQTLSRRAHCEAAKL